VLRVERIRVVEDPEVPVHTRHLDRRIRAAPLDRGRRKVVRADAVAQERAAFVGKEPPEAIQVLSVEDDSFQAQPPPLHEHLGPAVNDVLGCQPVQDAADDTLLQPLVDRRSMEAAGDADGSQQRHDERRLRVALTVAIPQNLRRRDPIGPVVSEADLVPRERVHRADSVVEG